MRFVNQVLISPDSVVSGTNVVRSGMIVLISGTIVFMSGKAVFISRNPVDNSDDMIVVKSGMTVVLGHNSKKSVTFILRSQKTVERLNSSRFNTTLSLECSVEERKYKILINLSFKHQIK